MKLNRIVNDYNVKITDEPFENEMGQFSSQTVRIIFRDKNKNIFSKLKYAWIDAETIYQKINNGEDLNLNNCYLHNFSLSDYRNRFSIDQSSPVTLLNFSACNAFFEAEHVVDFSYAQFEGNSANFTNSHFGEGNLSFYKAKFNVKSSDFSNTSYSEGNNNFQYAQFKNGNLDFENATFINGDLCFVNASFGDGRINFKNVKFGEGKVEFQFSKFGNGNISFEKSQFAGELVDFGKVEFGHGKLDFRRIDFGNAAISFAEIEKSGEKLNFKRSRFGNRSISFELAQLQSSEIIMDEAEFGMGELSFLNTCSGLISFRKCQLHNYVDLRVDRVKVVDLSNTIIRDIVDFKTGMAPVNIGTLYIQGVRNIGKIFIAWKDNNVKELIYSQINTSHHEKSDQFRILKEEFNASGRYEDEDKAYVEFKRNELKHLTAIRIESGGWQKLKAWPLSWTEQLVFDKMGLYATSPYRVLSSLFYVYLFYSLLFLILPYFCDGNILCNSVPLEFFDIKNSFYYSAITFLTIGYGECVPSGYFKLLAPIEGWAGVFMMSYFAVAFVRKILR